MSVRYEDRSILIDDRPTVLFSGEIQYYRVHPDQWRDRLEKLRAMGLNGVGAYVPWNFHTRSRDEVDFTSPERDLGRFLEISRDVGLSVVIRPGPYICNEWDLGGYPGWLLAERSGDWRTGDGAHLAFCRRWYEQVDAVIAPRQQDVGGSVVLYQIENEHWWGDRVLFDALVDAALADGITVPFISNSGGNFYEAGCTRVADGADAYTAVYAYDHFRSFARHLTRLMPPDHPLMAPEFRTSNMPFWGETAPGEDAFPSHWPVTFARGLVGAGSNFTNFFVAAGGVTPVGFGSDHISTCYGSDAPVAPWGGLTRKFYLVRPLAEAIASVDEQLSMAKPANEGRNTDNESVDCLVRTGPRGTFAFPISMSDERQEFAVVSPNGRRLPAEGRIAIAPRQSMFLMMDVDLGGGAKLVSCSAQVMKIWRDGDTLRLVVYGEDGTRGEAQVSVGDETVRLPFTCSASVHVARAEARGVKVVLCAVTDAVAERTWFVPRRGETVAIFGDIALVRPGADGEGRVRAESAAGARTKVVAEVEGLEVDGVEVPGSAREDGLREFDVAVERDAEVRVSYGPPLVRVEDESWMTAEPDGGAGWAAVEPFGASPDVITDNGHYRYRASIDLDGDLPTTLEFPGISSAEMVAYLNGVRLGAFPARRPNGYHLLEELSARFDVAGTVRPGRNELAVAFTVVGRHNQGRPIYVGFTCPPVMYATRDEHALPAWLESDVEPRRRNESELDALSGEAIPRTDGAGWREVDLSKPREVAKPESSQWHCVRWYRARVRVPAQMNCRGLFLACPRVDQMWVYAEGERVGMAHTDQSRFFDLRRLASRGEIDLAIALRSSWKSTLHLSEPPRLVAVDRVVDTGWSRLDGRQGEREGWASREDGWVSADEASRAGIVWYRRRIAIERPDGVWAPLYVELDDAWREHALIFFNGVPIGQYAHIGPDRRFYVPDELVSRDNTLVIAVDGHGDDAQTGGLCVDAYERRAAYTLAAR